MATRSEQFKADAQRAAQTQPKAVETPSAPHGHVEKKATVAFEEPSADGHRSRKSTRKSANRAKSDAPMERAQQMKQNTPEAQHARTSAHAERGNPAGKSR